MEIILTHEQADFDAAGSVLAAWLLDPSRMPLLPKRRNRNLSAFIDDYKTRLPFFSWKTLPKGPVSRIYITDTQITEPHSRMAGVEDIIIWDHHPQSNTIRDRAENIFDPTGACTTFLVEKLMEKGNVHPGRIYATLMLMGIYEDTGFLSYGSTTSRDIRAAAWLVDRGADLDLMRRYVLQPMTDHQQQGIDRLVRDLICYEIKGKQIIIAAADIREISDEFSAVAHQLRDIYNPDGLILLLGVKTGVRLICRSTSDDIDFGAMMRSLNGGGHLRAASGLIPVADMETEDVDKILENTRETVLTLLPDFIHPSIPNLAEKLEAQIPAEQLKLIHLTADAAQQLNMPVYIVGGVVRDLLQDHPVMDFDIVVEGDATRLGKEIVSRYGGKLVLHPQFFTAKWETPDGVSLDLISARSESYQEPAALPDVKMSDIAADLHRRDFTINTLAIRLDGEHYGKLLDICDGLDDLHKELIRTLHGRSFIDDPTRIFRAVRFEQRLGFILEETTLRQLREQLTGVSLLTGQRIWHELRLFCDEPNPENDFARIAQLGIAGQIHGSLTWNKDIEADCIRFAKKLPEEYWKHVKHPDIELADDEGLLWVWLSCFPQDIIMEFGDRLLLSKRTLNGIMGLAILRENMPLISEKKDSEIAFFLDPIPTGSIYCYSRFCSTKKESLFIRKFMTDWRLTAPFHTGNDLLDMGLKPGPQLREILNHLRKLQIDGVIKTREDEAAWINQFRRESL